MDHAAPVNCLSLSTADGSRRRIETEMQEGAMAFGAGPQRAFSNSGADMTRIALVQAETIVSVVLKHSRELSFADRREPIHSMTKNRVVTGRQTGPSQSWRISKFVP
jgi:hypothetical protein